MTKHKSSGAKWFRSLAIAGSVLSISLIAAAPAGASSSGTSHATSQVKKFEAPLTWKAPGPAIKNTSKVKALKGKTVWYIPIALQVPFFQGDILGMKQALGKLGMSLRVCDGQGQPTAVGNCLTEALQQGAVGVVTDSIPTVFAQNAFDALKANNIPVVLANEPYTSIPGTDQMAYISYANLTGPKMGALTADAIISKSNGKANTLIGQVSDSVATTGVIHDGTVEMTKYCTGCKSTIISATTANYNQWPSLTSTAITNNPNFSFVWPEYDSTIPGVQQGLQTAGVAGKLTMVSSTSTLSGLQLVKAGKMLADVGFNTNLEGWTYVDQLQRMWTGMAPSQQYFLGLRVFNSTSIKGLTINITSANNGSWYGPQTYQSGLQKLWGLG